MTLIYFKSLTLYVPKEYKCFFRHILMQILDDLKFD